MKLNVLSEIHGIMQAAITKKAAEKLYNQRKAMLPVFRAGKLVFPNRPGLTAHLGEVDLTKVNTPDQTIKSRWVLVGTAEAVGKVVEAL